MGRPLNKKYIGKRNVGSTGSANEYNDSSANIPGQTVGNVIVGTAGSFTSATLGSPVIAASGAITFSTTTTALLAGTQVVITGTNSGAGSITNGTYYVASSPAPTATGVTLVTTNGGTTVATTTAGTPTGLTFTYGQNASYTFPTPALSGEGGTTATGTPTYSIVSAVVTAGGSGYANTATNFTFGNAVLTITPSGNALTGTVTVTTAGSFTGPLAAGPQAVVGGTGTGGTVTITYGLLGATITAGGQGYISDGTSGAVKTVQSVTISATNSTGNTVTVSTTNKIVPGMVLTTATGTAVGNIAQSTAYYVLTVTNLTTLTLATSYANYLSATAMTQTTASSGTLPATATQYTTVTVGGNGTSSPAATLSLLAEVTSGFGQNARYASIVGMAWITGDTQVRMDADIVKQVGARSFRVNTTASDTASGTLTKLVGNFPTVAGTMAIGATDSAGGTYFVTKLTNRKVSLTPGGSNAGTQFGTSSTPAMAKWTTGSAVANVSVTIDNV